MDLMRRFQAFQTRGPENPRPRTLPQPPPGFSPLDTPLGQALVRTRGTGRDLGWVAETSLDDLALLCGVRPTGNYSWSQALFFDLETTGLSGAGALAFLAGVARFCGGSWEARQFFLSDPGDEEAFLWALGEEISQGPVLVTYNGKAFDWNLLESRFLQNRMRPPARPALHLDLLHPVRRLYRGVLSGCSLGAVEEGLLGFSREGDIPGSEIPAIFFSYLSSGDPLLLQPVLQHNLTDLESTALVGGHMARAFRDPQEAGEDQLAWARLFRDRDLPHRAEALLEALVRDSCPESPLGYRARLDLGFLLKSQGRFEEMARAFSTALGGPDPMRGILPRVELAKHCEHRQGDFSRALQVTEESLAILRRRRPFISRSRAEELSRELLHRKDRLLRRMKGE